MPSIEGYGTIAYEPPDAAAVEACGQFVRYVEFRPWLPLTTKCGMLWPGLAQYEGPKIALIFGPVWLRSP